MIIFERLGGWGLGNSLFQIAATIAIAKHNNTTYGFPDNCYFKQLRFDDNKIFKNELPWLKITNYENTPWWGLGDIKYVPLPVLEGDYRIDGFFQSEKYFKEHRDYILKVLDIKNEYKDYIKNKYNNILNLQNTCVLHVRRNDYLNAREMRVLDKSYYQQAVNYFGNENTYLIFSDDIEWCKNNFTFIKNKKFIEENNDLLEMFLMSQFKKHIIANSTFSWWGAWMAENNEVIIPNPSTQWFSDLYYKENGHNCIFEDLICKGWKIL